MATKRTIVKTVQQLLVQLRKGQPIESESEQEQALNDILAFLLEKEQAEPVAVTPEEVSNIASDVMRRFFDLKTTPAQDKRQIRLALVTVAEDTLRKVGGKYG